VVGPSWLAAQRYTITAKVSRGTTQEECRLMLRNLLNERFQMRLHTETRSFRVYYLVVSEKGPKLTPKGAVPPAGDDEQRRKTLLDGLEAMKARNEALPFRPTASLGMGRGAIADLIERLSLYLDRPVIDHTQLDGLYGFSLHWVADGGPQTNDMHQGPSLFAAIEEQLGLNLTSARDQLQVLVIDAVQSTPVE